MFLGQVGGTANSIQRHVSCVDKHPLFNGKVDFKLTGSDGPFCEAALRESHFDTLHVTLCEVWLIHLHHNGLTRPLPPSYFVFLYPCFPQAHQLLSERVVMLTNRFAIGVGVSNFVCFAFVHACMP